MLGSRRSCLATIQRSTGLQMAERGACLFSTLTSLRAHRWGFISREGDFNTMVVKLDLQTGQPLRNMLPGGRMAAGPYSTISVKPLPHNTRRHELAQRLHLPRKQRCANDRFTFPSSPVGVGSVVAACVTSRRPNEAGPQTLSGGWGEVRSC